MRRIHFMILIFTLSFSVFAKAEYAFQCMFSPPYGAYYHPATFRWFGIDQNSWQSSKHGERIIIGKCEKYIPFFGETCFEAVDAEKKAIPCDINNLGKIVTKD